LFASAPGTAGWLGSGAADWLAGGVGAGDNPLCDVESVDVAGHTPGFPRSNTKPPTAATTTAAATALAACVRLERMPDGAAAGLVASRAGVFDGSSVFTPACQTSGGKERSFAGAPAAGPVACTETVPSDAGTTISGRPDGSGGDTTRNLGLIATSPSRTGIGVAMARGGTAASGSGARGLSNV
jgi:hypothetical protein